MNDIQKLIEEFNNKLNELRLSLMPEELEQVLIDCGLYSLDDWDED